MNILIGTVVIVLVIFMLYVFFKMYIDEKKSNEKLAESLADERIYHPETGKYISLEEAEAGVNFDEDSPGPIYTDDLELFLIEQLAEEKGLLKITDEVLINRITILIEPRVYTQVMGSYQISFDNLDISVQNVLNR